MSYVDLLWDMLTRILGVLNEQVNLILDLLARVPIG